MRKIIARLLAIIICVVAATIIYFTAEKAYFHAAIKDFIHQGENFAQNKPVDPAEVNSVTTNGKFVHYIAVYWRTFQDLNSEMDNETTRMLSLFDAKNLASDDIVAKNLVRMNEYRALIQDRSAKIDTNVQNFMAGISGLKQDDLKIGNIQQVKIELAKDRQFRKDIVDVRKTIASYMYAALEFLQSRRATISFAQNGAITFANPADQKYFYSLMDVVKASDQMLKNMMISNRNDIRQSTVTLKSAYEKMN